MPFPNPDTQFKPGQSGNPKGASKGSKHISTWIQDITNDPDFTVDNFMGSGKQFKGAPMEAIIAVAISNAMQGDDKWGNWLAKYGWTQKIELEHSGEINQAYDPKTAEEFAAFMKSKTKE